MSWAGEAFAAAVADGSVLDTTSHWPWEGIGEGAPACVEVKKDCILPVRISTFELGPGLVISNKCHVVVKLVLASTLFHVNQASAAMNSHCIRAKYCL